MNTQVITNAVTKKTVPPANAVNEAGGAAYKLSDKETLASLALTSTFADAFYVKGGEQLDQIKGLAGKVDAVFLAKLAVYSAEKGRMKDVPAVLFSILYTRNRELAEIVFPRIATNGKMLRNIAKCLRSPIVSGQHNLSSSALRRMFSNWFNTRTEAQLVAATVGNDPTLKDIIRMSRPKMRTEVLNAYARWVLGKSKKGDVLPSSVKAFEDWKAGTGPMPNLPFEILVGKTDISKDDWKEIAKRGGWHATRINLNTYQRHDVFSDAQIVDIVADKLANPEEVARNRVFPYQLFITYLNTTGVPQKVRNALQRAVEHATRNVPKFDEYDVFIGVDTSGSMGCTVTGHRGSATSVARCVDAAAVLAASVSRVNPNAVLLPFDTALYATHNIDTNDSIMTVAGKLAKFGGGGTNCSLPIDYVADNMGKRPVLIIMLSDNESWVGAYSYGTASQSAWTKIHKKNNKSKMVCINLSVGATVQVLNKIGVMNIGGFSDNNFELISKFVNGETSFVTDVDAVDLTKTRNKVDVASA